MSTLKADTIQNTSGGAATLTKQRGIKGHCNYTAVTNHAIRDSLNVSSLSDDSTGQTTISYSNNYANTDYTGVMYSNCNANTTDFGTNQSFGFTVRTTSAVRQRSFPGSNVDAALNDHMIIGDLA